MPQFLNSSSNKEETPAKAVCGDASAIVLASPAISSAQKRKKWTESEERSLIDKYAEMQSEGALAGMRTREKKFRPIAAHVNARHHSVDSATYPFVWSWKDASTKVQNMRHQYLLVKQKLISSSDSGLLEPDWSQGLSLWPNFLRYRHVFGDAPLPPRPPDPPLPQSADGDLGLGLGFGCSDEDGGFGYEEAHSPFSEKRKKKKKRRWRRREERDWARVSSALAELRELEERLERRAREADEMRRSEEEEKDWEGRMERRRAEWRKRMSEMMEQHRAEMEQIHARLLHEQHALVNQVIGIISGIGDVASMGGHHYVTPGMMHQVNGMVPGENRVGSDEQDDQFIVDA